MDAGDTSRATQPTPKAKRTKRPPFDAAKVQGSIRTLYLVVQTVRARPEVLQYRPTLQETAELQLEALALAKALARGREYSPMTTRPAWLAPWEVRELATQAKGTLQRMGFKPAVRKAVATWFEALAIARASNPLPERLPRRSKIARQWKDFQMRYRELRKPEWRGSLLAPTGDLREAHKSARRNIVRLTLRPELSKDPAGGIALWRLRVHALERAIEKKNRRDRR